MQKIEFQVTNIAWERIHMYMDVSVQKDIVLSDRVKFLLANSEYLIETEFDIINCKDNTFKLALNITNSGINRCISNGIYTVLIYDQDNVIGEAGYEGTSHQLEGWGRTFRYSNNVGAYTVTCLLDEFAESSRFLLLFYNTVSRGMSHIPPIDPNTAPQSRLSKYRDRIQKRIIKSFGTRVYTKGYKLFHKLFYKKNAQKKTILFLSEQDNKLALNMQVLYDRMKERGLEKEYNLTCSLRKATSEKQTFSSGIHLMKSVAQADLIIVDDHVPLFDKVVLSKDTKMIQIWHAGAGFKGVGYSRWGHCGCPGPFSCHRQYDFCISGSSNISGFFSEQFGILDEQIIPTGMPRMDIYLNKENREKVTQELYERYPMAKGNKVLLFAPTYRGRNRMTAYYPYEKLDFQALYDFCEEKGYVVFFKMHPWVSDEVPIQEQHKDRFFDLNSYPNINELFYITDLLITDYSSSIYEFSLMDKPMMFFVYDKVQYSVSRGFHRDYDSTVPGKVCESFEEIMTALWKEDFEFEKVEKYRVDHFDFVDDHAADRVIDWLILGNLPDQYKNALQRKRDAVAAMRGLSFREYFVEEGDQLES